MARLLILLICFFITACSIPLKDSKFDSAIVDSPSTEIVVDRAHYQMKYYSSWKVDTTDEDYDIDSYFSIDSHSETGHISFFIFNTYTDEVENVENQIEAHLARSIKNGKVVRFENWGQYKGHGATISGKFLGIWKGELQIFAYSNDSASFLTVSEIHYNDTIEDMPGLKLIQKTFKIK